MDLWRFRDTLGGAAADLRGMTVEALDGSIGKVQDVIDRVGGSVVLVDTGPWIFGKTVKLPAGLVSRIDVEHGAVLIDSTKDEVKNAPEEDSDADDHAAYDEALATYYSGRQRFGEHMDGGESSGDHAPENEHVSASVRFEAEERAFGGPQEEQVLLTPEGGSTTPYAPTPSETDDDDITAPPEEASQSAAPRVGTMDEQHVEEGGVMQSLSGPAEPPSTGPAETPATESASAPIFPSGGPSAAPAEEAEHASPDAATRDVEEKPKRSTDGQRSEASTPSRSRRSGGKSERRTARTGSDHVPIAGYDGLTAAEIVNRLRALSQRQLGEVERYERRGDSRQTVLNRIASLREAPPWSGYDEATVDDVTKKLSGASAERAKAVRDYERRHRDRKGVMEAARRVLA